MNFLPGYDNWKTMSPDEEREEKPMTIRLQLFNNHDCLLATHDVTVVDEDDMDARVSTALSKLLLHSWTLTPGDCIRINEV